MAADSTAPDTGQVIETSAVLRDAKEPHPNSMTSTDKARLAVAALVFSTREKDYGGIHLGIAASDVMPLRQLLESIASAESERTRQIAIGRDARALAGQIFPRGRFSALRSLQLKRADQVRISVKEGAGIIELTATAARAVGDLAAVAHTTGGDMCIVGDSGTWTDRLWLWPL